GSHAGAANSRDEIILTRQLVRARILYIHPPSEPEQPMDGAAPESPPEPAFGRLEGERLGAEITELCGYLYAGTYRLLTLIRTFDEKGYWGGPGDCSCAHWLNFKCGIGMNAAREKVRVAHALAKLPRISAAFARGERSEEHTS